MALDPLGRLKALVRALRKTRFVAKSGKLRPDHLQTAFEDIE